MVDGVLYVTTPYNNAAALDAETGKERWRFDSEDVWHVNHGASPPVVYRDIVVVGSSVPDRYQMSDEPPGIVQGFDARTGKRLWVWNAIPLARLES